MLSIPFKTKNNVIMYLYIQWWISRSFYSSYCVSLDSNWRLSRLKKPYTACLDNMDNRCNCTVSDGLPISFYFLFFFTIICKFLIDGFYSPYISSPYIWREPSPWNYNEDNVEIRGVNVLCYMDNDCICSDIKKKITEFMYMA